MKLTNHNKDNYYYDNGGSVMNGTIEMTRQELEEAKRYMQVKLEVAKLENDTYTRDNLPIALTRITDWHMQGLKTFPSTPSVLSLGIEGTKAIVKLYDLPNYKHQNYGITITN